MIILKGSDKLTDEQTKTLVDTIKVLVYVRVSTEDQAKHGYSLESQIDKCVEDALKKNKCSSKDEIIALVEMGVSGDNSERPALNYGLQLLELGFATVIYFLHPDRMARDLALQTNISQKVWGLGKDIAFVEAELDKNSPESVLMFNIHGSFAQYNKAKILANSKRGRRQKAKNGKISGMNRLYGYNFDTEKDILVEDSEEKEVYLLMVDMLLTQEYTCSDIARTLSLKYAAPKGDRWYQSTVSRILKNEAYMGIYYYGKTEVVQNKGKKKQIKRDRSNWIGIPIPQYITETTYFLIQEKLKQLSKVKSGRPSEDYLLKSIARCGRCGGSVSSGVTSKTKNGLLKYYSCTNKSRKSYQVGTGEPNKPCLGKNWRVDKVDQLVWEHVINKINNPEEFIGEVIREQGDEKKIESLSNMKNQLQKTISDKEEERERYIYLFAKKIIKSEVELESKIEVIDADINILSDELNVIDEQIKFSISEQKDADKIVQTLRELKEIIIKDKVSIERKKQLVRMLIRKVVLNDDGTMNVSWAFDTNKHKNSFAGQSDGMSFYADVELNYIKPQWGSGKHTYTWEWLTPHLDAIKILYQNDLLSFQQLADKFNCNWWDIKYLLKHNDIPLMSKKKRAASLDKPSHG